MKKTFSVLIMLCLTFFCFSQTILEPEILNKVQASVFEVVTNKAQEGGIEYEKELPFSRLPFSVRNDKYNPIGTAFLTKDGNFYSAAHVFNLYENSIYKDYYIRDRNGNVYQVDKITKFSTNRDFISFTVKDFVPEEIAGLSVIDSIPLNSTVFSVGNALGDGIVIRNGVLTSQTYETENGEWKWLRFSAAASPGNSGGPLISPQGEVLGIITMKSENENLNYALPFSELSKVEDNIGYTYIPFYYSLPNLVSESFSYSFKKTLNLPMELKDVQHSLISDYENFTVDVVKEISKKFSYKGEKGLATLTGKAELLNTYYGSTMPITYFFNDKGKWSLTSPETTSYPIEDEGVIQIGYLMNLYMAKIYTPESTSVEELISSPKKYMDYLFEASGFSRNIGGESVVIKSVGEPKSTEQHTDYFGRIWQVNQWNIDFADSSVISYAIPLPDGIYVIYVITSNSEATAYKADIGFLTDYQYFTYMGTIQEWEEYLNISEKYLAKNEDFRTNISINKQEESTKITVGEFAFDFPKSVFDVKDSTNMAICTSFFEEDDKVVLTYRSLDIYTNKREQDYRLIHVNRVDAPLKGAQKNTVERYNQKVDEVSPYDREPYNYEQFTYLDTVIFPEGTTDETKKDAPYVYVLAYEIQGQNKNQEIVDFAKKMETCFSITEASEEKSPAQTETKTETTSATNPAETKTGFFSRFK